MKMESNRRLFVMLRPLDPMSGHSGYARLELSNGRAQITVAVQGFTGAGYCVPAAYGDPPQGFEEADFMAAKDGRGHYCLWEEV